MSFHSYTVRFGNQVHVRNVPNKCFEHKDSELHTTMTTKKLMLYFKTFAGLEQLPFAAKQGEHTFAFLYCNDNLQDSGMADSIGDSLYLGDELGQSYQLETDLTFPFEVAFERQVYVCPQVWSTEPLVLETPEIWRIMSYSVLPLAVSKEEEDDDDDGNLLSEEQAQRLVVSKDQSQAVTVSFPTFPHQLPCEDDSSFYVGISGTDDVYVMSALDQLVSGEQIFPRDPYKEHMRWQRMYAVCVFLCYCFLLWAIRLQKYLGKKIEECKDEEDDEEYILRRVKELANKAFQAKGRKLALPQDVSELRNLIVDDRFCLKKPLNNKLVLCSEQDWLKARMYVLQIPIVQ